MIPFYEKIEIANKHYLRKKIAINGGFRWAKYRIKRRESVRIIFFLYL
ncbi:hypothetical protein PMI3453 [Proteus mirabilis HI4320]|uniref:Uncharacterized protein n=1 Tax=Proteus mirabilis (strain HI4320) TaxID=529507 RepID=B4F2M0_PROMH|nr:hypothetical protein PMI3453 [Proteus mirabilis HI4320]